MVNSSCFCRFNRKALACISAQMHTFFFYLRCLLAWNNMMPFCDYTWQNHTMCRSLSVDAYSQGNICLFLEFKLLCVDFSRWSIYFSVSLASVMFRLVGVLQQKACCTIKKNWVSEKDIYKCIDSPVDPSYWGVITQSYCNKSTNLSVDVQTDAFSVKWSLPFIFNLNGDFLSGFHFE